MTERLEKLRVQPPSDPVEGSRKRLARHKRRVPPGHRFIDFYEYKARTARMEVTIVEPIDRSRYTGAKLRAIRASTHNARGEVRR